MLNFSADRTDISELGAKLIKHKNEYATWRRRTGAFCVAHKVSSDADWTARRSTTLRGVPKGQPRMLSVIDTAFNVMRKQLGPLASSADVAKSAWVDISQASHRRPWTGKKHRAGYHGPCRTATTSSWLYSFESDAVLSGMGQLRALGAPDKCAPPSRFSEADCRALSGEMYPVCHITILLSSYYCNPFAPWWKS